MAWEPTFVPFLNLLQWNSQWQDCSLKRICIYFCRTLSRKEGILSPFKQCYQYSFRLRYERNVNISSRSDGHAPIKWFFSTLQYLASSKDIFRRDSSHWIKQEHLSIHRTLFTNCQYIVVKFSFKICFYTMIMRYVMSDFKVFQLFHWDIEVIEGLIKLKHYELDWHLNSLTASHC